MPQAGSQPPEPEEFLDINDAAAFLNVSVTSLRRWTTAGQLACLRVGRKRERRFRRSDLLAFMEEQAGPQRQAAGRSTSSPDARRRPPDTHVMVGGTALPNGTHLAGLYDSDEGRTRLAVAFLAGGLEPGSAAFLISSPATRKAVLDGLGYRRVDLQARIKAGRLAAFEYQPSVSAQIRGLESRCLAAIAAGARAIRVVGDMVAFAAHLRPGELERYEAEFTHLIARRFPVVTICIYDVRRFTGQDLLHALRGHEDTFRFPIEQIIE